MRNRLAFWALSAALLGGCGGKVAVDNGTGGTTTIATGGNGGAPPANICGGKAGLTCGPDAWCQFDPPGSCGGFDNTGTCQPKPSPCPPDCPGVCGCDGNFYCSACAAHLAGTDVSQNGTCFPDAGGPDPEYAAYMMPTDLPRYIIAKTEHAADRCVLVTVAMIDGAFPNIQVTMGWGVQTAFVTPHASDCLPGPQGFPNPFPGGEIAKATDGKGTVKQDSTGLPCAVSVDVAFAFPASAPWVPATESLQVDGLLIQNGGCLP
jgi:hypothetical protein